MTVPHKIIAELRKIRQQSRISQGGLGIILGSAQNQISNWESGRHAPNIWVMADWAESLGLELVLQPKVTT